MNPIVWLGAGGLAAYLLLRSRGAAAATPAPAPTISGGMHPTPQAPTPAPPAIVVVTAPALKPNAPQAQPGTKPPQITTGGPPVSGEVAPPKPPAPIVQLGGRWGWPVPRYEGRAPVISDGFGSARPPGKHMGVDLMFARISSDRFPIGPNGSKAYVMPDAWMAVAASDGVLWSAGHTPRGFCVVLDHGNVATFYQHLDTLFVPETKPPAKGAPKESRIRVKASQPLGVIGGDPLDPSRLKHLHFELWLGGPTSAVDPAPLMKSWQVFTPNDLAPFLSSLTRNAPRRSSGKRPDFVHVTDHERRWPGTALHPLR